MARFVVGGSGNGHHCRQCFVVRIVMLLVFIIHKANDESFLASDALFMT